MTSSGPSTPGLSDGPSLHSLTSLPSPSSLDSASAAAPAVAAVAATAKAPDTTSKRRSSHAADRRASTSKPVWMTQVKDWLSVAEPSAQAMREQKRSAYKKAGVDPRDPQAAAKMHVPIGQIPRGATTSTAGPSPEKALMEQLRDTRRRRESFVNHAPAAQSVSSGVSSAASVRQKHEGIPDWDAQ